MRLNRNRGEPPMKKAPASEVTSKMIRELMNQAFDASELMRASVRLVIEQALEAEVGDALERGMLSADARSAQKLSQWLPHGTPEAGGRRGGFCRAAGHRHGQGVRVAHPRATAGKKRRTCITGHGSRLQK